MNLLSLTDRRIENVEKTPARAFQATFYSKKRVNNN